MHFSKISNQQLCLLPSPLAPMDGLQLFAASPRVLPLLGKQKWVWVSGLHSASVDSTNTAAPGTTGVRSSAAFEVVLRQNNPLLFTKDTWKPGRWLVFWFLVSRQSSPTLEQRRGLGWAEMVPSLSQWGWTCLEGLFDNFPIMLGALLQPFLCAGSGMWDTGQVTNWHWSWLRAQSSLQCPPEPPAMGRVGPQKPLMGGELFLLCRTQESGLPEPWREAILFSPSFKPSSASSLYSITFPHALHSAFLC